jgi:hypothetical protein
VWQGVSHSGTVVYKGIHTKSHGFNRCKKIFPCWVCDARDFAKKKRAGIVNNSKIVP